MDQSGAVVPGAIVTVTLTGTDSTRSVTADKDGAFDIPELAVGSYDLTAEARGFKKFVAKDIVVTIGHVNLVTVNLQLGGSSETVTVEANAVQVETTSTQLGAVMTDASIRELPLNTRNAYALLQLQPGVQSQLGADLFAGSENPGVVSVNGGRGRSNNYMVNGGDGNDIFVNSPRFSPLPMPSRNSGSLQTHLMPSTAATQVRSSTSSQNPGQTRCTAISTNSFGTMRLTREASSIIRLGAGLQAESIWSHTSAVRSRRIKRLSLDLTKGTGCTRVFPRAKLFFLPRTRLMEIFL